MSGDTSILGRAKSIEVLRDELWSQSMTMLQRYGDSGLRVITMKLPKSVVNMLDRIATTLNLTRSDVIRAAIMSTLKTMALSNDLSRIMAGDDLPLRIEYKKVSLRA